MKIKSLVLLAVALGCGLVAMLGVQQVLSGDGGSGDQKVKVLIAKSEIAPGQPLDDVVIGIQDWHGDELPPGALTEISQLEGRTLKTRVFPGDIVSEAKLREKGKGGASINIPKGMRVVAVPVTATTSISGMVSPGDRVDLMCTWKELKQGGGGMITKTRTILEYIEVFAVDRVREAGEEEQKTAIKPENLSVVVTPEQMLILELAKKKAEGPLQVALRNLQDKDAVTSSAVDDEIFSDLETSKGVEAQPEEPKVVAKAPEPVVEPVAPETPKKVWTLRINEGDTVQKLDFEIPEDEEAASKELDNQTSATTAANKNPVQSLFNKLLGL
jgi:pilus assembly protein CpaB